MISLATGAGRFPQALARLGESVRASRFGGEFLPWPPGSFPTGCPEHLDVPFAFKPYCFAEARERGFGVVLWLDAACVAIRSLKQTFATIERRGYILFQNRGSQVGEWCADAALAALGTGREEAMAWPELNAAAIGLNLGHPLGIEFLRRWHAAAREGTAFRGITEPLLTREAYQTVKWNTSGRVSPDPRVRGHRHDQSVAGILAAQLGMHPSPRGLEPFRRQEGHIDRRTVILLDRDLAHLDRPLATVAELRRARHAGRLRVARAV